jgi:capsular polysaccharide transport system permease protein
MDRAVAETARPRSAFLRGLAVQRKVIGALVLRELHTRYGRENIGYAWLILEPAILAGLIALIHSRSPSHFGSDMKPVPFALVGYCTFMMFRGIFNRSEGALEANLTLMYHRTVQIFDIMLARAMLEALSTCIAFFFLLGIAVACGVANLPYRPLMLLLGLLCMFLLSFGLSLCVVSITHDRKGIGRLIHPIGYIMLPLSGVFAAMQWLPSSIAYAFSWIPMSHVMEIVRYGQFRSASPDFIDWGYLVGWILIPTLLGLVSISVLRGKIHMP